MANNSDTAAAWAYHNATSHTYASVRAGPHSLDWSNRPSPYKLYRHLDPLPLPRDLSPSDVPALQAIRESHQPSGGEGAPDLAMLARLLYFSAGITRTVGMANGEMAFRAASCTGALYHIDLYLVCGDLPALDAGVYHFGVHDFSLRRLRSGDFRAELASATADQQDIRHAPAVLIATSTSWRNAWKYRARAYRHAFWDSGTILANLLALAAAHRLPARLVLGFADGRVNRLLDIDGRREAALALVALGRTSEPVPAALDVEPLYLETEPVSRREIEYPEITAMHRASSLESEEEVAAWRERPPMPPLPPPSGRLLPLGPAAETRGESLEQVILRRTSTRSFAREPVTLDQISTLLSATGPVPFDFWEPGRPLLNAAYVLLNAAEGLPPGEYLYRRDEGGLELLREGMFRDQAGHLGLEQELPADAAGNVYFMAALPAVLERFGNRGYRAAQLEAAINGGRVYLASHALGLGATGLTFYDQDVTDFFSPSAAESSPMFLAAFGRPGG